MNADPDKAATYASYLRSVAYTDPDSEPAHFLRKHEWLEGRIEALENALEEAHEYIASHRTWRTD